jgi:hypothetical protein
VRRRRSKGLITNLKTLQEVNKMKIFMKRSAKKVIASLIGTKVIIMASLVTFFLFFGYEVALAGLKITRVSVTPSPFYVGDNVTFSVTVQNTEGVRTQNEVRIILDVVDKTTPGFTMLFRKDFSVDPLNANETRVINIPGSWTVPSTRYPKVVVMVAAISIPVTGDLGVLKTVTYLGKESGGKYGYFLEIAPIRPPIGPARPPR